MEAILRQKASAIARTGFGSELIAYFRRTSNGKGKLLVESYSVELTDWLTGGGLKDVGELLAIAPMPTKTAFLFELNSPNLLEKTDILKQRLFRNYVQNVRRTVSFEINVQKPKLAL